MVRVALNVVRMLNSDLHHCSSYGGLHAVMNKTLIFGEKKSLLY